MPTWQLRHASLNWEKRPLLMGIVNLTPDSFADGGRYVNPDKAVAHAMQLVTEGADIIDLGAESSRPGAEPVSIGVEIERLLPVVTGIREVSDIPISIDTRKAEVAARALDAGADIINDITAGRDKEMLPLVAAANVPIILMHMQGEPQTMQKNPLYSDVVAEVGDALLVARDKGGCSRRRKGDCRSGYRLRQKPGAQSGASAGVAGAASPLPKPNFTGCIAQVDARLAYRTTGGRASARLVSDYRLGCAPGSGHRPRA
jgi:hypothetical protein